MSGKRLIFLAVAALLVFASTGCAGGATVPTPTPAPQPTPISSAEVSQRVQAAMDNVQTAQGIAYIVIRGDLKTFSSRSMVWFKRPQSAKVQVVDSTEGGLAPGTQIVFDGQAVSIYDPETNRVIRIDDIGQAAVLLTMPGNLTVFVVQLLQLRPYLVDLNTTLRDFNASIVGTDTIAGRPANILLLQPTEQKQTIKYIRLWVAQDDWLPLKIQTINPNDITTLDLEFESLDTNIPLSDEIFTISPNPTPTATSTPAP